MRVVVWALLALLALTVLPVVVLVFAGLIRRFQIWRTCRELQRMGFVGSSPSASETRSIWPRMGVGVAGLIAVIIAMLLPGGPLGRTLASTVVASLPEPTHAPFIPAGTNPGSEHPSSAQPSTKHGAGSPPATPASAPSTASSESPVAHVGGDGGAPSTVTALPASASAIELQWESVSGATGYDVERSTDSVTWSVVSKRKKTTRFTDLKLKSGTTYFYRVAAYVDGDDVVRSDVVSATTTGDASNVPVLISATGSATSVELSWSDVDGELGYWIQRSPDGTNWSPLGTNGQGVTTYVDSGLASATTYYYRVVAMTSDGGSSVPSNALSATTDPSVPPTSAPNAAQSDALNGP